MWTYFRCEGMLSDGETIYRDCYSGRGNGLNNPSLENVHDIGPLPAGFYRMASLIDSPHTGPHTIILIEDPLNEMFGRSLFRIHGDNPAKNFSASDGCIVCPNPEHRIHVFQSSVDKKLQVI